MGVWLRDIGRGSWRASRDIAEIAVARVIGKSKPNRRRGDAQEKLIQTNANRGLNAEIRANLGWVGMSLLKSAPIWDDRGRGEVIESQTLPLADQKIEQ